MSVIHMRIDNRLIHGQVTTSWVNSMRADRIIVTNDQVANDALQKMLLPQAARGMPTSVLSVDDTLKFLATKEGQKERVLIIAKFPKDGLRLIEGGVQPAEVNVGNQAPTPGTKFKMVAHTIAVTSEDAEIYRAIGAQGYKLTSKMMPSDRAGDFLETLKKNKF
jgi:mannose/fructose/N-acetylgalactosamine-specific phosphotransferase system component IIB